MIVLRTIVRAAIAASIVAAAVAAAGCQQTTEQTARPASVPSAGVPPVSIERGRELYKVNCTPCHGARGEGDGPAAAAYNPRPRNHTDAVYMSKLTDEDIAKVIQFGGAIKGMPMMPSNPALRGADLAAVVAYTRSLSAHGSAAAAR
jgi:mono/diheme cytochrome c family protein